MAVYDQDDFELSVLYKAIDEHYFNPEALCSPAASASGAQVRLRALPFLTVCGAHAK